MSKMAEILKGPWRGLPLPPPPRRTYVGRIDVCEDIPATNERGWSWPATHVPCRACGPYCNGPDCLCREAPERPDEPAAPQQPMSEESGE